MKWHEIKITTTDEASDAVSEMLTSIGAGGVAIEDPNDIRREVLRSDSLDYADEEFLSSLGNDVIIKAYFQGDINITELEQLVKEKIRFISNFLNTGHGYSGYTEVDDEDWSTAWKKYYKPIHISKGIVIKPSWEDYNMKDGEIVIELDPGMAFGTGTHETTAMCAGLLQKYLKQGDEVIDVGCGTGILSIIAAKLGANHITAVDIDEVAIRVTRENCIINSVHDRVHALRGVLDEVPAQKADIVAANIIANIIIDISKIMPYYLKAGGYFIASGIIKERSREVMEACEAEGFSCIERLESGEWVAMVFKCLSSL
ncbi:[LSU ribosomal protein L11P]-lysine N-methyltransferase [Anaerobacterium chartisolvens]|uniref:Ribosomal protein L11 methyltransferase n=1 Tax=Anaerobacterium chartisolvens TaxID=1297424 RepID=A0A369B994_9FIRM|nr:50S ribosomal protein L11 methyltransferase [Anaerobacterium chartisolvens]RCX17981.1 [LSU ribosomal protein L11P]-lysine N-methyltransferase [Anaerobacterium chartisolvens]